MKQPKLYEKAKRRIERLIAERVSKPGNRIPAESELARALYVSRTTIRNALKALEQEGKIERAPGGGAIVRRI
jgi:DNA-binding GntR family transcriptional regulator